MFLLINNLYMYPVKILRVLRIKAITVNEVLTHINSSIRINLHKQKYTIGVRNTCYRVRTSKHQTTLTG